MALVSPQNTAIKVGDIVEIVETGGYTHGKTKGMVVRINHNREIFYVDPGGHPDGLHYKEREISSMKPTNIKWL